MTQTEAAGINDLGTFVGNYLDSNQVSHAFRWSLALGFTTIDFAPQAPSTPLPDNAAASINNANTIVGNFEDTTFTPFKERAWVRTGVG